MNTIEYLYIKYYLLIFALLLIVYAVKFELIPMLKRLKNRLKPGQPTPKNTPHKNTSNNGG